MEDFRTRQHSKSFFSSPFFFVILLLVFVFFARSTYFSFYKKDKAAREHIEFQEEYTELKARYDKLQENIEYLETERGTEEELRKRYDVVKDGEILIKIIEEE
jgi:cell division protein FtsB